MDQTLSLSSWKVYGMTGVKKVRTFPYNTQTDDIVEIFNSILKNLLRKLVNEPHSGMGSLFILCPVGQPGNNI